MMDLELLMVVGLWKRLATGMLLIVLGSWILYRAIMCFYDDELKENHRGLHYLHIPAGLLVIFIGLMALLEG
jgi:hypothetical protein